MDTYIFGYGSLMYPSGINGRGMEYIYGWEDLQPAGLLGYKRGMFSHYVNNYYGIMPSKNSMVSGVVFKIHSAKDFGALLKDEGASEEYRNTKAGLMYEVENVTKDIYSRTYPRADREILALVNVEDKSGLGKAPKSYIKHVYKGIQPWGTNFVAAFLHTGGVKPSKHVIPFYGMMRNPLTRQIKRRFFLRGR